MPSWGEYREGVRRALRAPHPEAEAAAFRVDLHLVTLRDLAGQQLDRQHVLDLPLQEPLQGTGPVRGVEPLGGQVLASRVGEAERDLAPLQPALEHTDLDVHDLGDLVPAERLEHDDLVDPVHELGSEGRADLGHHLLRPLLRGRPRVGEQEPSEVGGHDDHGVAEVHRPALPVGETAVVEQLQQHVERILVRLLDLVQQHDGVRAPAHRLGELSALVVADVSGRRADQSRHGVSLLVLAHVDPDHGPLVVEEELRERSRQLGLPHARRPEEHERADRPARVGQPGPGAADGVRHGLDRLVLIDDPLVQLVLHPDQFLHLALHEARDRDAGPRGDDLCHVLPVDLLLQHLAVALDLGELRVLLVHRARELHEPSVPELGGPLQIPVAFRPLGLAPGRLDLRADLADPVDMLLLPVPVSLHGGRTLLETGQLPLQAGQPLLRRVVRLLSKAGSFSTCLRYSSSVVAPMARSSPRASIGFSMLPASTAPSAAPAPTTVCSSSMNVMIWPSLSAISRSTALNRSSNSPRYFDPAISAPMSRATTRLSFSDSGTSPATILWASPSTMAVLPTPGSPIRTGLFFVLRESTWITRRT